MALPEHVVFGTLFRSNGLAYTPSVPARHTEYIMPLTLLMPY